MTPIDYRGIEAEYGRYFHLPDEGSVEGVIQNRLRFVCSSLSRALDQDVYPVASVCSVGGPCEFFDTVIELAPDVLTIFDASQLAALALLPIIADTAAEDLISKEILRRELTSGDNDTK